jgi:chromodomain-helicase-DNA-binding protein 1
MYLSMDEDSEAEYGSRAKVKPQQRRKRAAMQPYEPMEVRFSTRRAAKVTNYNEDDELDEFVEDEEEGMHTSYAYAEDESIGGIDVVLDHRPRDGVGKLMPNALTFFPGSL